MNSSAVPFAEPEMSLSQRIAALGADDQQPASWTPEHVTARMVEAFRIERRAPWGRTGPSGAGQAWPSLLIDMAKATDHLARQTMTEKQLREAGIASRDDIETARVFASDRPGPDQLSRMEQALQWPMIYLAGHPREADAITIWTYAKANKSFEIKPFFAERRRQADILARRMSDSINRTHPEQAEARRKRLELAREVNAILNNRLASVTCRDEADEAKRDAIHTLAQWCVRDGCAPVVLTMKQAVPNYCLWWSGLERARKRAALIIAKGLRSDRIPVR